MSSLYPLAIILAMAAVTFLLRLAPFALLSRVKDAPYLRFLAETMPLGVMVLLVVYSVCDTPVSEPPYGLPTLAAVAVAVGLYLWRRSALLAILASIACYVAITSAL